MISKKSEELITEVGEIFVQEEAQLVEEEKVEENGTKKKRDTFVNDIMVYT